MKYLPATIGGAILGVLTMVAINHRSHPQKQNELQKDKITVNCRSIDNFNLGFHIPPSPSAPIVEAKFVSLEPLLRVRTGYYYRITNKVTYHVTSHPPEFTEPDITFILNTTEVTADNPAIVDLVPNVFLPGTTAHFWMMKEKYETAWVILNYEIWGDVYHAKSW